MSKFTAYVTISGTGAVRRTPTLPSASVPRVLPFLTTRTGHFLAPNSFCCEDVGLVGWGCCGCFLRRDLNHLEVRILEGVWLVFEPVLVVLHIMTVLSVQSIHKLRSRKLHS